MKVIEPGHIYELDQLDGDGKPLRLVFVNRETGTEHEGTQTQEVLRVVIDLLSSLIDRTNHCDACLRWEGNDRIIKAMSEAQRQSRLAILHHEARALERKMDKAGFKPEKVITDKDGHFLTPTDCTCDLLQTITGCPKHNPSPGVYLADIGKPAVQCMSQACPICRPGGAKEGLKWR